MKRVKLFLKAINYSLQLLYKSSKLLGVVYILLKLLLSSLPVISTFLLKLLVDNLIEKNLNYNTVIYLIVAYIVLIVLLQLLGSVKTIVYKSLYEKSAHLYECDILKKLEVLPMSFIDTSAGKDALDDVRYIKDSVVSLVFRMIDLFSQLYLFIIAFITLLSFNLFFSFFFLFLSIPAIVIDWYMGRKAIDFRHKTAPDVRKFSYYRWMLTDIWPAKDVRMYNLTDSISQRYKREKDSYKKENIRIDKKELRISLITELIKRSGEIIFTIFVVVCAIRQVITIGDLSLYIGFALLVLDSFQNIVSIFVIEYADNTQLFDLLFFLYEIECYNKKDTYKKIDEFISLEFKNVYFKYPNTDSYVLSGTSFTINKGDKLSIVGINGSGKSTIIKLMLGLYEIESGQILINRYPMSDYDMRDVRKLFSVLFQSFVQYPLTLRENIALSSLERMDNSDEIEGVLTQSGVYEGIKPKLENGLDSFMTRKFDDKGTELSKGQWQKIALSRAYFKNAPIIIFDEPSAALDAEAEDRIFKNFESISDGKTGIMISHRISSARMSNKIIVLDGGKITEQGTHEELVSLKGLYAKLFNLQREKYTIKEGE